ncbi:DUF3006 domain-containing protein [Patescibacteria group bacterium]|nr:DUF3006 domain-containing protein [Patescibacteria group bacterium]
MSVIKTTIDRVENEIAVLRFSDGQELQLPLKLLPAHSREGSVISLSFGNEATLAIERQEQAKALLNEILKTDQNDSTG